MDPTLFRVDWDVLAEVLAMIVVLSFLIERALSLIFEHRLYVRLFDKHGYKTLIALVVSLAVVVTWEFDALSILMVRDTSHWLGFLVTAATIAGGSKAAIKLFHDVLKVGRKPIIAKGAEAKPARATGATT